MVQDWDWIAHLTALEYSFRRWKLFGCGQDKLTPFFTDKALKAMDMHDFIASRGNKEK